MCRDAKGQTPLMLAVAIRAYPAGLALFDAIGKISKERSPDFDVQKKVIHIGFMKLNYQSSCLNSCFFIDYDGNDFSQRIITR